MIDLDRLKEEQLHLSQKVILKDGFERVSTIAGVESAYLDKEIISCIVVCAYPSMELLEKKIAVVKSGLPYIPGFQAYRELPAITEAFYKLSQVPDVLLVKGNGILHPRKFDVASHVGLMLNVPTIGVSKTLGAGRIENGKIFIGVDLCGFEVKTRDFANPLFISPGHLVSLGSVLNIVSKCIKPPHKLPEPLHLAHKYAEKERERRVSSPAEKKI